MKNKVKGFAYPDWVDHWQDYVDKLMDKSSRDIGKIFPHLAFDPIEDLPLTEKERKEQEELMDKIGIKGECRNTARMIISTMPKKKQTIIDIVQAHEDACTGRDRIMKIARTTKIQSNI